MPTTIPQIKHLRPRGLRYFTHLFTFTFNSADIPFYGYPNEQPARIPQTEIHHISPIPSSSQSDIRVQITETSNSYRVDGQ